MLGLGAVGVVVGQHLQAGVDKLLEPVKGLAGIVPGGGGFIEYTVVGGFPAPPADYRLRVGGMVATPLELTVDDLRGLPATRLTRNFQCVTGWVVDGVQWAGVRLTDLARHAGALSSATAFEFSSFDGVYTESMTLRQAEQTGAIVAYEMLGRPITRGHGGPVRLYVPAMFGYKSIKWLSGVTLTDHTPTGYWEQRGYPADAWIAGHPPAASAN